MLLEAFSFFLSDYESKSRIKNNMERREINTFYRVAWRVTLFFKAFCFCSIDSNLHGKKNTSEVQQFYYLSDY